MRKLPALSQTKASACRTPTFNRQYNILAKEHFSRRVCLAASLFCGEFVLRRVCFAASLFCGEFVLRRVFRGEFVRGEFSASSCPASKKNNLANMQLQTRKKRITLESRYLVIGQLSVPNINLAKFIKDYWYQCWYW